MTTYNGLAVRVMRYRPGTTGMLAYVQFIVSGEETWVRMSSLVEVAKSPPVEAQPMDHKTVSSKGRQFFSMTELAALLPDAAEAMRHGTIRIVYATCERTSVEYRCERTIVNGRFVYDVKAQS